MSFLPAAHKLLASLKVGSPRWEILNYLIRNAVGSSNAKSWEQIHAYLVSKKIKYEKGSFQQGLLKNTRESDSFIGSYDHGSQAGYFIINTQLDAELMRDWY